MLDGQEIRKERQLMKTCGKEIGSGGPMYNNEISQKIILQNI